MATHEPIVSACAFTVLMLRLCGQNNNCKIKNFYRILDKINNK